MMSIRIAWNFPRFVDLDSVEDLIKLDTMGELDSTLKCFKKDKSQGPDGWLVEFYLSFFNIIGPYLLKVIKDCKTSGRMYEATNTVFIALIPKKDSPQSFSDFWPISLCSCMCKIIAKIIANRIKMILSDNISSKKISFLHNCQIQEAIGIF